jgi:hypothetical protein
MREPKPGKTFYPRAAAWNIQSFPWLCQDYQSELECSAELASFGKMKYFKEIVSRDKYF